MTRFEEESSLADSYFGVYQSIFGNTVFFAQFFDGDNSVGDFFNCVDHLLAEFKLGHIALGESYSVVALQSAPLKNGLCKRSREQTEQGVRTCYKGRVERS